MFEKIKKHNNRKFTSVCKETNRFRREMKEEMVCRRKKEGRKQKLLFTAFGLETSDKAAC